MSLKRVSPPRGRIALIMTGGTIAMAGDVGAQPDSTRESEIVDAVKALAGNITVFRANNKPSPHVTFEDVRHLADLITRLAQTDAQGIVITHGTDTLEDVAIALDLSIDVEIPVVITGALRPADHPGADGAANLVAAVRVALHPSTGKGVFVVVHDEIHAARFVMKQHASAAGAFASPGLGPIGWLSEGSPYLMLRPPQSPTIAWRRTPSEVVVVTPGLAQEATSVHRLLASPPAGVIVAGLGGGHVPVGWIEPLEQLAGMIPCILSSRCMAGGSLRSTYSYAGSERDLLSRGLISGGAMQASKARILLALLLAADIPLEQIKKTFEQY